MGFQINTINSKFAENVVNSFNSGNKDIIYWSSPTLVRAKRGDVVSQELVGEQLKLTHEGTVIIEGTIKELFLAPVYKVFENPRWKIGLNPKDNIEDFLYEINNDSLYGPRNGSQPLTETSELGCILFEAKIPEDPTPPKPGNLNTVRY